MKKKSVRQEETIILSDEQLAKIGCGIAEKKTAEFIGLTPESLIAMLNDFKKAENKEDS